MNEQNETNAQLHALTSEELAIVSGGGTDRVEVTKEQWEKIVIEMARKAGYNMAR